MELHISMIPSPEDSPLRSADYQSELHTLGQTLRADGVEIQSAGCPPGEWRVKLGSALGSNLGDRETYLAQAIERIDALPATKVASRSSIIETAAQYVTDQPDFLNAVIRVETKLPLFAFFTELQAIEVALGRIKEYDKGPRTIDLDLLCYGDMTYATDELTVPHPLMEERDFVMRPLKEVLIDPR